MLLGSSIFLFQFGGQSQALSEYPRLCVTDDFLCSSASSLFQSPCVHEKEEKRLSWGMSEG